MPMRTIAHVAVSTGLRRSARGSPCALGVAALALTLAFAHQGGRGVFAYPSSQTIPGSGPLPQDSARAVTMNAAIGEREGAWIVVNGAQSVSRLDRRLRPRPGEGGRLLRPLRHFSGRFVPDALLPVGRRRRDRSRSRTSRSTSRSSSRRTRARAATGRP